MHKLAVPSARLGYLAGLLLATFAQPALATDYFLTIGGGYNPGGNQASLEANVLFFQQVLRQEHSGPRTQTVFFADGDDEAPDLQVVKANRTPVGPLTELLGNLHARGTLAEVEYRNHRVPNTAGPISPQRIKDSLRHTATGMQAGDRLIIYVTAHGEAAKGKNEYNTYISCWDGQKISAREFSDWLDEVPTDVPVIMIMAQCYCGGYARTIFHNTSSQDGLTARLRCGFFAQQHDLPAAGCRPDIDNDEEYSSFFWGAFLGRSRNGGELLGADADGDGQVSFAEAHAQAVIVSETIDIPLRTSEVLLRRYSRIVGYEHRGQLAAEREDAQAASGQQANVPADSQPAAARLTSSSSSTANDELRSMQGSIQSIAFTARPDARRIVLELCGQLGIAPTADVTQVFDQYSEQSVAFRDARQSSARGRRGRGSGRRELREEIAEKWPELGDRDTWRESALLAEPVQPRIMQDIEQLPNYERFAKYLADRTTGLQQSEVAELREVKFRRLINTLENIVLAQNLPLVVKPEIVDRYQTMLKLEESHLSSR